MSCFRVFVLVELDCHECRLPTVGGWSLVLVDFHIFSGVFLLFEHPRAAQVRKREGGHAKWKSRI